jgi:hypothetical protein
MLIRAYIVYDDFNLKEVKLYLKHKLKLEVDEVRGKINVIND